MYKNRLKLFQLLKSDDVFEDEDLTFSEFLEDNFSSAKKVLDFWDFLTSEEMEDEEGEFYYEDPIEQFYKDYCCDLDWAKVTSYCKKDLTKDGWDACVNNLIDYEITFWGDIKYMSNTYKEYVTLTKKHTWKSESGKKGTWECYNNKILLDKKDDVPVVTNPVVTKPVVTKPTVTDNPTVSSCIKVNYTENDILSGKNDVYNCMKGDIAGKIQSMLKKCGFPYFSKSGNIDNIYGPMTESMVKAFQQTTKGELIVDGIVGDLTYKKLKNCKSSTTTDVVKPPEDGEEPGYDELNVIF